MQLATRLDLYKCLTLNIQLQQKPANKLLSFYTFETITDLYSKFVLNPSKFSQ